MNTLNGDSKKYGVPLYGVAWVPADVLRPESSPHLILAGGGGEGNSGIPNAILLSRFHDSNTLSDEPVAKIGTGDDLPYRMAVQPGGEGLICSLPKSCLLFEWDELEGDKLSLKSSEKHLNYLEDVGQQLALTFNDEGSILAVGGEDGKLRVFKWPSMEVILDEANVHTSVNNLDFSPDGKFLVSVGRGSGRIWDVTSAAAIASLPNEKDEVFGYCRFSRNTENQVLYVTVMKGNGGSIVKWDTTKWKRMSSTHIIRDPICAFNASADGKLLAIGTIEGDILIINSTSMRVRTVVKKAHLGFVTALTFSQDSRALVSASMDSSVRVTLITDDNLESGLSLWIILLIILLAVAAYFAKTQGFLIRQ